MRAIPLFGLVAGSILSAWAILHSLQSEDKVSTVRGVCLMALGFIFFVSSFDLCNCMMFHTEQGKKIIEKYKLTLYDVMDISNKLVSAMQAVLSSISGTIVCTFSCPRNMLRTSHFMSQAYAWFGASYFIYDVYSMFVIHNLSPKTIERLKKLCNITKDDKVQTLRPRVTQPSQISKVKDFVLYQPVIIMHHLFIGLYGFLVVVHLRKSFGDCVFGFIFLMELSTPLVSFRGILSRLRLKQSRIYIVNGIVMIVVFFICRIFLFLFLIQYYSRFIETSVLDAILTLPTICQISLLVLILPQLYWFALMTRGAFKLLFTGHNFVKAKVITNNISAIAGVNNHQNNHRHHHSQNKMSGTDDAEWKNENHVR